MRAMARAARAMAMAQRGNCEEESDGWNNLQNKINSFVSALDQPIAKRLPRGVGN
jgi:hypothetical protein